MEIMVVSTRRSKEGEMGSLKSTVSRGCVGSRGGGGMRSRVEEEERGVRRRRGEE